MRAASVLPLLGLLALPAFVALPAPFVPPSVALVADTTLTEVEKAHLFRAREEEKLARDLYNAFAEAYPAVEAFENARRTEAQHMAYVGAALTDLNLDDPVGGRSPGHYASPEMQRRYDAALAAGRVSLAAALRESAGVVELDLVDLDRALAETALPDLDRLYARLARGSRHHLRLFVTTLADSMGEAYAPQHLSREAFDAVMRGEPARAAR